jgi:diguanylate cyclase (GGDEF)-like protein
MTLDRRCSDMIDRRKSPNMMPDRDIPFLISTDEERNRATFLSANDGTSFIHEKSDQLREEVVQARQKIARLRELAVLSREEQVRIREAVVYDLESKNSLREDIAASVEQKLGGDSNDESEQEELNLTMRLANEKLVITSIKLQIANEEIEKSKLEMTRLAHYDFLTDLPNRAQLYDRIGQAIAMAKRNPTKLAILLLDLDRFKQVNDTLGHSIGDGLLQSVAQRLKSAVRNSDTVSRLGGDEFVLLLSEVGEEEGLAQKLEKIHAIITAPYSVAGHDLHIGATIGISVFPQDGEDSATLIRNADTAMYYAKENGRNNYQFYMHEMGARDAERLDVEVGLHHALNEDEFVLFYQAQFNLENDEVSGVEALIRWQHPRRGLLFPSGFIAIAEDCGVIVPMGRWVLREACRQAKSWLDASLRFNIIAVNISALEFESNDFLENIQSVLQETGLPASFLELELTESSLMKNIDATATTLHILRSMGVSISIDDFGTGYSSLSYLKNFPIDTMKIDQSFVRDITTRDDNILLNAIIGIGKSLRHQVIAEGVENAVQLAFLRENKCTAVQGYYLNVPMPVDEFDEFLKQRRATHVV